MRIVVLGEANDENQDDLITDKFEITSAQQAGQRYGFGSPLYAMARILLPLSGAGISGIPIIVMPQAAPDGATTKILHVTPVGTATDNGTHYLKIAGRDGLEGEFYAININTGDTADVITDKMRDAVNAVLGAPVIGTSTDYEGIFESKWSGLTAEELNITVDTGTKDLGITYTVTSEQSASGTPSIAGALAQFGNDWNTIVINGYGLQSTIMAALEAFNGIPDPVNPTGRFAGIIMKPFIALSGSVLNDPSSITDARKDNVTIAVCPAPGSAGFSFEAAANMGALFGPIVQNSPELDVSGLFYPDMPTPTAIGDMADYNFRNSILKKGCSTVDLVSLRYKIMDFVTTYHPVGETPPQFSYCRNLMLDFNVRFSYYLLEQLYLVDHVIAADDDTVNATKVVKPKTWKQVVKELAADLVSRALVVDLAFMQASITVNLDTANPNRLNTFFKYKRSGFARVSSTVAEAGFNFGTLG
jgi:phage tail sheath gpL-like